jgi:hypothetical protein
MMQATDFADWHYLPYLWPLDRPLVWCILVEREVGSAPWWEHLRSKWPFEAVDPLLQLEQADCKVGLYGGALDDLCSVFPDEVRVILEFGLAHRTQLMGLFGRMPFREEETVSLIRRLGAVGNRQTVRLLGSLVDAPDLGPYVVEACGD